MLDDRPELELVPDMAAAAPDPAPSPRQSWPGRTETREAGDVIEVGDLRQFPIFWGWGV